MTTSYDQVRYPNWPVARSHPGSLGALAKLLGREIVSFSRCRVLEIACSEGVNIANMAIGAPRSEFWGIDLAESAIERGRETVELAGLANVVLKAADLRDLDAAPGMFDYIIAHGVYSWIPKEAREGLMTLIGRKLSPNGLAFVSYNVFPGCRARQTIRDFLTFALRGVSDPEERLTAARAALEYQLAGWDEKDSFQKELIEAARNNLERPIEVLFHDEMGEHWSPQFLMDVVEAARAQGLDYLADAHPDELSDGLFPSERFDAALSRTGGDWAHYGQWLDFTNLRRFRWSVFCRAGAPMRRIATPGRVIGFYAMADLTPAPGPDKKVFAFKGKGGVEFETDDERLGGIFEKLAAGEAVALDEFADAPSVVESLLRLYVASALSLSTEPPLFTKQIADKPLASPLARAQSQMGDNVLASLHHRPVRMEDPFWSHFLPKLDGAHSQEDLALFVAEAANKPLEDARKMIPGALGEVAGNRLLMR
jgi:hypothetical protein